MVALAVDMAYVALQSRRNEMIDDFHRKIEAGEAAIAINNVSAWGDVPVSVNLPLNALSSVRVSQGYHMASASLSFSTGGRLISTQA